MKTPRFCDVAVCCLFLAAAASARASSSSNGVASWYGEEHRGRLMANGRRFNPDRLTAASWFYPLGTKLKITLAEPDRPSRTVIVTVTDRGPSKELVRDGRIIDLTRAAFKRLARPERGLVPINVEPAFPERLTPIATAAPLLAGE